VITENEREDIMIEAWFDGACEPVNPGGHGAWGAIVKVDGPIVYREGGYCGAGPSISNNVAEYSGFCAALTEALRYPGEIRVRGDSRLVICQLSDEAARACGYPGKWKMKGGLYQPFYERAVQLLEPRVALEWVPRENNNECDVLSKEVLRAKGVRFRIQADMA
jgi:ribonuclease HI